MKDYAGSRPAVDHDPGEGEHAGQQVICQQVRISFGTSDSESIMDLASASNSGTLRHSSSGIRNSAGTRQQNRKTNLVWHRLKVHNRHSASGDFAGCSWFE
jgi:hypothetical protein